MNKLYPTSQMLAECITFGAAPNKAIVGANAFAHAAGIHQHGVMVNPLTYEIMTPESVGVAHNSLVLGKHSGRRALEQRYVELGQPLTREQLNAVYTRFTELADRKKTIYDQDLLSPAQTRTQSLRHRLVRMSLTHRPRSSSLHRSSTMANIATLINATTPDDSGGIAGADSTIHKQWHWIIALAFAALSSRCAYRHLPSMAPTLDHLNTLTLFRILVRLLSRSRSTASVV